MKIPSLASFLLLLACNEPANHLNQGKDSSQIVLSDTIPLSRKSIKPFPVAAYSEKIPDELNDWKFAVEAYETRRTFHFTLKITCKEITVTDSVNVPNFGIAPKLVIQKAKEPMTCIVGFSDKHGVFQEYKRIGFQNDRLRVKQLKTYYVNSYKTVVSD
ncbi:MAG: hypothetical protein RLZZ28_584 [Bacteroidota bacterium]|jgi:hypothetical protein